MKKMIEDAAILRELRDVMIENAKDIDALDLVELFDLGNSAQDEDTLDTLMLAVRNAKVTVTFENLPPYVV